MPDHHRLSRRHVLSLGAACVAGAGLQAQAPQPAAPSVQPPKPDPLPPDLLKDFVGKAHANFEATKGLLAEHPTLLNATWDWGSGDFSTWPTRLRPAQEWRAFGVEWRKEDAEAMGVSFSAETEKGAANVAPFSLVISPAPHESRKAMRTSADDASSFAFMVDIWSVVSPRRSAPLCAWPL